MSEQELFAKIGLFTIAFGIYVLGTFFVSLIITHDIDDWSASFFVAWFFGAIMFAGAVMILKGVVV